MSKSKICFITTRNIFNVSSLEKYLEITNNQMDIIYWDQHDICENFDGNMKYKFNYSMKYGINKFKKFLGYFKFRRFVLEILRTNKYDKLILLPTQLGFLMYSFLRKHYKYKYILDIRDYTYEYNKFIYFFEKKLIKNSGLTIITSPAYTKFLPPFNYVLSHNIVSIDHKIVNEKRSGKTMNNEKVVISCIGSIRFIAQFIKIINLFKNDSRFELRFIGRGSENLRDHCESNNIKNVQLIGRFEKNMTISYYMNTDIVLNLYGNNDPFLDYALSNKLYYSAMLAIPILVCPNTYMAEIVSEYHLGDIFDINDQSSIERLYRYFENLDKKQFIENCDKFIHNIKNDEQKFQENVSSFLF